MPMRDNPHWEHDERWSAVDNYAVSHLVPKDDPYGPALEYAIQLSAKEGLPPIEVSPLQGRFLKLQCMALKAKNILEVGTLGGYSSILLAASSPEAKVTTIEINEKHKAVAEQAHAKADLTNRIDILLGPGNDVLPSLQKEISSGKRDNFDFVFIDADKENNLNYLNAIIPMCLSNTLIIVDNVVRKGTLADAEAAKTESKVEGARRVVEAAGKDERLECSLMQTVGEKNYDGFLLCVVK